MTPEEAAGFCEEDEDPQKIFGRFDAAKQIAWGRAYIRDHYATAPGTSGWYSRGGSLPGDGER